MFCEEIKQETTSGKVVRTSPSEEVRSKLYPENREGTRHNKTTVGRELHAEQCSILCNRKELSLLKTEWKLAWPEQGNEQVVVTWCRKGRQGPDQVGPSQTLVSNLGSVLNTVKIYWRLLTMKITFSIYILHHSSGLNGSNWLQDANTNANHNISTRYQHLGLVL